MHEFVLIRDDRGRAERHEWRKGNLQCCSKAAKETQYLVDGCLKIGKRPIVNKYLAFKDESTAIFA